MKGSKYEHYMRKAELYAKLATINIASIDIIKYVDISIECVKKAEQE